MVNAGFGSAGERCMAISAAVAVGPIADELVAKIAERAMTIKTGDGTRDADMGPLVTKVHRDKVASYIDAGEADGATLVLDGRNVDPDGGPDGFWLGPTLLDHVTPQMSVYTDEIFGPVLSVVRVESYDEALELINSNPNGNGTAIFTNDGGAARRFQNEVEVGMVGNQRADPGSDGLLQLRRLEGVAVRGTPTPTAWTARTSSPAARRSPVAGSTPARRHRTRLPTERLTHMPRGGYARDKEGGRSQDDGTPSRCHPAAPHHPRSATHPGRGGVPRPLPWTGRYRPGRRHRCQTCSRRPIRVSSVLVQ